MVPELVSFVILLVVFILAYGLASQALINPAQVLFCCWRGGEKVLIHLAM